MSDTHPSTEYSKSAGISANTFTADRSFKRFVMGGGASKPQPAQDTPLQIALKEFDVDAVKALLADPNTVLSSTPTGKPFRSRKRGQEPPHKYVEAQKCFNQENYVEGVPPVVFMAKLTATNPAKTAEILTLLLADPRVTVDAEIGAMAAGFAHHHEAPLTVLKGDVRTALDGWSLHHDPTAMNIGAALALAF